MFQKYTFQQLRPCVISALVMSELSTFVSLPVNDVCKCVSIPMVAVVLFSSWCVLSCDYLITNILCLSLWFFSSSFFFLLCIARSTCQPLFYLPMNMKFLICVTAKQFVAQMFTNIEYTASFSWYQILAGDMRQTLKTYLEKGREAP